jgi:hypothetical protein
MKASSQLPDQPVFRRPVAAALVAALAATAACARKPASIEVSPRKVVLYGLAHPKEVVVRVLDKKGKELLDQPVVWTSSDRSIAEASGAGHVSAKKPGRATLTVSLGTTAKAISGKVPVEVVDLGEIFVNPPSIKLFGPPGTTARLEVVGKSTTGAPVEVPAVVWSAENPGVAKVASDGTVTSVGTGKTMVLAKLGDLLSESEVQAQNRIISRLELRPETALLKITETQRFTAVAYDEKGLLIPDAGAQFSSLNPELVKMGGDGKATAVAKGTATVSASLGGKVARATVLIN